MKKPALAFAAVVLLSAVFTACGSPYIPKRPAGSMAQAASAPVSSEDPDPSAPGSEDSADPDASRGGLDPDFKVAMDHYEEFIDTYIDFQEKYNENPDDLSLLAEYLTYMNDYAALMEDLEQWEASELNPEELSYYIDVQAIVSKKLLEITT